MRGTLGTALNHLLNRGIIPAYAGNTFDVERCDDLRGDHPRVCGEHRVPGGDQLITPGSSPRMRGTP